MGEWTADETATVKDGCASYCTAHLWIVPAKVEGTWQLPQGELSLKQAFQMVTGSLKSGSNVTAIANGKLNGDQLTFSAGGTTYTGRVSGNTIEGSTWKATRLTK